MVLSSPQELHREANLLLGRLAKSRGYVIRSERDGAWQIYTAKNRYGRAIASASDDIIQFLRRQGHLSERAGSEVAGMRTEPR
jgi:hypothetical protein